MTQMTTVEELIEILKADPEIRQRLFEAFGLSALPELFRRMDSFEGPPVTDSGDARHAQQDLTDPQRNLADAQRALQKQGGY